jgi:hypothetical protein
MRTDGQSGGPEDNNRFRNFSNAPNNPKSRVHSNIVTHTHSTRIESVILQEMYCEENSSQTWKSGLERELLISPKN